MRRSSNCGAGTGGNSGQPVGYVVNAEATLTASPILADITADGQITRLQFTLHGRALDFNYFANQTSVAKEHGKFGDSVAWTRYLSDTANNAVNFNNHLLVGTPSATIPASGKIDYLLVGGTAPTDYNAPEGEIGTFTGSLAVGFGPAPKVGIAIDVTAGSRQWHVQTAGGSADPANGGLAIGTDRAFAGTSANLLTTSTAGGGCVSTCATSLNGNLFGQDAAYARFGYTITDKTVPDTNLVNGVAVFGRSGTARGYLGNAPSGGGGGTTLTNATTFTLADGGTNGFAAQEVDVSGDGAITRVRLNANSTTSYGSPSVLKEHGQIGDAVAWSRWDNSSTNAALNPNSHIITGTPAVQLPASRKVDYVLVGSTAPINFNGADGQSGTVSGALSVSFGSQVKVGFNLDVQTGPRGWHIGTTARALDPASGLTAGSNMRFAPASVDITPINNASCLSSCSASVVGSLYGAGASHVGLGYQISDLSSGSFFTVNGATVFGQAQP